MAMDARRLTELKAEITRLKLENEALHDELEMLKRHFFGRSSEKTSEPDQPLLFDDPGEEPPADTEADNRETPGRTHTRTKSGRKALPKHIEREEIILDIEETEKQCACGHELTRIGEEVSEKLEVIPPMAGQESGSSRMGVVLPRQRMADWVMAVTEAAAPIVEQLLIDLRAGPVMLLDGTTVQVLGEENRPDSAKSVMWVG